MPRSQNYFASIDQHFLKTIYDSPKGAIRLAILQRDLAPILASPQLKILDIGAGGGQMALWCASLGHQITLLDKSAPLLENAQNSAEKAGLSAQITCIEGDALHMPTAIAGQRFDVVLCHAVLEWVAEGEALFAASLAQLSLNGYFSLMFYNRLALEFTQHVFGNFDYVDAGLKAKKRAKLTPDYPRSLAWVEQEALKHRLRAQKTSGIRCFYDYMKAKDRAANSLESIIAHELSLSERQEFLPVARYVHRLWQKTEWSCA